MIEYVTLLALIGQAGDAPEGPGGMGDLFSSPIILFVIIGLMAYLLLFKPEKKRKEEREKMLGALDRGAEVMTNGGIYGQITNLSDKTVTLQIAPNVKVKVSRQHIGQVLTPQDKEAKDIDKGRSGKKKDK